MEREPADESADDHERSPGITDPATIAGAGERVRRLLRGAVERLAAAGARDEALAEYVGPRRVFLIPREPVMIPVGRAWRVGVLLIDADGGVFATGSTTRAVDPGRRGYTSESARDRAAYRAAAVRGGFREGETVNFGWRRLEVSDEALSAATGPIIVEDGVPFVRWGALSTSTTELGAYLEDRVSLLVDPPPGS